MIIDAFRDRVIPLLNEDRKNKVNFIFGDSAYIREYLLALKSSSSTAPFRFPLIGLYTPIQENVNNGILSASVNLIIAVNTLPSYTNEQRVDISFKEVLRPLYNNLIESISNVRLFNVPYSGIFNHTYIENLSFGKRGALDIDGKEIDEKIDAIEIKNLDLTLKNVNCNANRL